MKTKSKLKPETIKLLRQIKRKILEEPRQFVMELFFTEWAYNRKIPNCHTAACIGGWAIAISRGISPRRADDWIYGEAPFATAYNAAKSILGLTAPQARCLFSTENWPKPFSKPYGTDFDSSDTPKHNAQLAARRIEHFIRTGK